MYDRFWQSPPDYLFVAICRYFQRSGAWFENSDDFDTSTLLSSLSTLEDGREAVVGVLSRLMTARRPDAAACISALQPFIEQPMPGFQNDRLLLLKSARLSGLRNLGATCYMNSIFQMLRFSPFCAGFLNFSGPLGKSQNEFQNILMLLRHSLQSVVDTSAFINSFLLHGQPINQLEPQDAMEFLQAVLGDIPDELLKPLQGVLGHHIEGIEMPHEGVNSEGLQVLSVRVEGMASLENALDRFFWTETIMDYALGPAQPKISIRRYSRIKELPQMLIVHLQRFIYSGLVEERSKIGTKFTFPVDLDVEAYVERPGATQYRLTGVVLHIGNVHAGHFYYVGFVPDVGRWVSFNDDMVTDYKFERLETDAFGNGSEQSPCAYLLCYTKVPMPRQDEVKVMSENNRAFLEEVAAAKSRQAVAASQEFFEFAMKVDDPFFLFLYYQNVLIHLNVEPRWCAPIRQNLIRSVRAHGGLDKIQKVLEKDARVRPMSVFLNCHKLDMVMEYVELLKAVISIDPDSMCELLNALCTRLNHFFARSSHAKLIVQMIQLYEKVGQTQAEIARSLLWPMYIVQYLAMWYQTAANERETFKVDFSIIFSVLLDLMHGLSEDCAQTLFKLEGHVTASPAHSQSYYALMQTIQRVFGVKPR
jgi:ubiquitin C-terminal hydrolase